MTDPTDPLLQRLARFDPDPPRPGHAPDDVRRRGDRFRRRRTAATLGTAVVVALAVLTPFAVLGGRDDRSAPAPTAPTAPATPTAPASPTAPTSSPTAPAPAPAPAPSTAPTPTDSPVRSPEPGRADAPGLGDIPASFPLAAGLPARAEPGSPGLQGPGPDVGSAPPPVCGEPRPAAGAVGSLGVTFSDVASYQERQLLTFETAEAAVAWVDAVREQAEACPVEEDEGGLVTERGVRELGLGGQSYAVVTRMPGTTQLVVTQVVRLGRAVLVDLDASEAGAGPDPEADLLEVMDRMSAASGPVVSAMCVFTVEGCGAR